MPARAAALLAAALTLAPTGAEPPRWVDYAPPVDAPVVEPFRPPPSPFGPGNRGVDYATAPGDPVRAAAAGTVTFAGPVAGALHVTVLHADGLRTTYAFVASVAVERGDAVAAGDVVATAGRRLHLSARLGEAYLDPEVLFAASGPPRVHLVPDRPPAGTGPPAVPGPAAGWAFGDDP